MRAVIQLVSQASVTVENQLTGAIGAGLLVYLGVCKDDSIEDVRFLADKITHLRIFPDHDQLMNKSLSDVGGEMLVVSQFTLLADCRKGRRPSYSQAARPELAETLYNSFVSEISKRGIQTATGRFQTTMKVSSSNEGPITIMLDSKKSF